MPVDMHAPGPWQQLPSHTHGLVTGGWGMFIVELGLHLPSLGL